MLNDFVTKDNLSIFEFSKEIVTTTRSFAREMLMRAECIEDEKHYRKVLRVPFRIATK